MRPPWILTLMLLCALQAARCDLEPTLKRCCLLGTSRAAEQLTCNDIPGPVSGVPPEQQSICLATMEICCLKHHREQQCEIGKRAARDGTDCLVPDLVGGEHRKDCCEACKLGMISGSMGMGCSFKDFAFTAPWDKPYEECCREAQPQQLSSSAGHVTVPTTLTKDKKTTIIPTPALDSLCDLLPGELCAHICIPIPGSFRCMCREGFTLMADGKSCQHDDLPDRCKLNNPCSHKCLDTGIAIECSCNPGYQLAIDERSCNDIDECALGAHACEHGQSCQNEPGSYSCKNKDGSIVKPLIPETAKPALTNPDPAKCPPGYQYNIKSQVCDDVDECLQNTADCESKNACQNTIGSYTCVRKPLESCPPGYQFDERLQTCTDVDECTTGIDNCYENQLFCVNTPGSFECRAQKSSNCPAGYKFNKFLLVCEDVDECEENLHGCAAGLEICRNTIGAYECDMKCDSGYQYNLARRMCIDVNECREELDSCDHTYEKCINEIGSYRCEPLVASSATTTKSSVYDNLVDNCDPGYSYSFDRKACLDVNECLTDLHNCSLKDGEECVNIPGSFICKLSPHCPTGYQYSRISMKCEDKDECLSLESCSFGEQCVNTPGGYHCNPVCNAGFILDNDNNCIDVDECYVQVHTCNKHQRCVNTIGSFRCEALNSCQPGFRQNENHQCDDIDECAEGTNNCDPNAQICFNTKGSYQCHSIQRPQTTEQGIKACSTGFKFDSITRTCADVNECEDNTFRCLRGELCVNTQGSYHCRAIPESWGPVKTPEVEKTSPVLFPHGAKPCPAGFRFDLLRRRCFDVNECEEGTHVCNLASEACLNEPGGYRCGKKNSTALSQCKPGFKYSEVTKTCIDVDECVESNEPVCDSNQDCKNNVGSYTCTCKKGYQLDPLIQACVDINECQVNLHDCLPSQRCDNTIGSFHCIRFTSCGTGYTLNAQTGLCEDDDECTLGTDNCRSLGPTWQCRNTLGSFRCERKRCEGKQILLITGECKPLDCPSGYEASRQGQCIDINECERNNPCRRNQQCVNVPGSHRCVNLLNCPGGYELNEAGSACLDIDECNHGTHDCKNGQQCINSNGGYICQCPQGHLLNQDKECVDIDECARFSGQICPINSQCHNTVGSYRCICKDGFRQDPKNGNSCIDIDECSESPGLCHQNCINVWGSYRCSCNQGFTLQVDNRTCQDIDECEQFKDRNLCVGICVNQPGSYSCQCPEGYRLGTNGHTCQDIDECLGGNVCRNANEVCLNTRGSFRCNTISCPPHFVKDPEHKNRCKRETLFCREGDTECLQLPTSYSFNFITFVSNLAIPTLGYIDLFTMRGPLWASTNVRFKLEMLDARAPSGISTVKKDFFQLRRTAINQAIISLVHSIEGPQEIELQLTMELFHGGIFGGAAVAKLYIFVSQYEF